MAFMTHFLVHFHIEVDTSKSCQCVYEVHEGADFSLSLSLSLSLLNHHANYRQMLSNRMTHMIGGSYQSLLG